MGGRWLKWVAGVVVRAGWARARSMSLSHLASRDADARSVLGVDGKALYMYAYMYKA